MSKYNISEPKIICKVENNDILVIDNCSLDGTVERLHQARFESRWPGPIHLIQPDGDQSGNLFPGGIVTNCTFGGTDLKTLYVTAGGCLYRAETDRQGLR